MYKSLILFFFIVYFGILSSLGSSSTCGPVTLDTVDPELELLTPIGGESWYFGDTQNIQWQATDDFLQTEPILIEFSSTGNQNFNILEENYSNSGSYPWQFPEIESSDCYIQLTATDMMGNITTVMSTSSFSLGYVPPQTPTGVNIDVTNGIDALLSWEPVTATIYDTPIVPDGYIILYNETPYEDDENKYYFLGYSTTPNYTHQFVASFREEFYYSVKSYKNFSARTLAMLEQFSAKNQSKLFTWGEIKTKFMQQGATK